MEKQHRDLQAGTLPSIISRFHSSGSLDFFFSLCSAVAFCFDILAKYSESRNASNWTPHFLFPESIQLKSILGVYWAKSLSLSLINLCDFDLKGASCCSFLFPSEIYIFCTCKRSWKRSKSSLPLKTLHLKRLVSSPAFNSVTLWHHSPSPFMHLHNWCLAASWTCKNEFAPLLCCWCQACVSWPVRADWVFGRMVLKETEAKTLCLRQRGNTELSALDSLRIKACKPLLVVILRNCHLLKWLTTAPHNVAFS